MSIPNRVTVPDIESGGSAISLMKTSPETAMVGSYLCETVDWYLRFFSEEKLYALGWKFMGEQVLSGGTVLLWYKRISYGRR